jgi:hypothetical protein
MPGVAFERDINITFCRRGGSLAAGASGAPHEFSSVSSYRMP